MGTQLPSQGQPSPKGLTPAQIGAGVGAAVTCLSLLVARDLSRPVGANGGGEGGISNFLLGVYSAIGAIAGMAIFALASAITRRKRKADIKEDLTLASTAKPNLAVDPALAPGPQAEGNGSPILRAGAALAAILFALVPLLMVINGNMEAGNLTLMVALAITFGWYAVRGRKGLPGFLTKKLGS